MTFWLFFADKLELAQLPYSLQIFRCTTSKPVRVQFKGAIMLKMLGRRKVVKIESQSLHMSQNQHSYPVHCKYLENY